MVIYECEHTTCVCMYVLYGSIYIYKQRIDQPGKVTNPARGQLNNRENEYFPVPVRA